MKDYNRPYIILNGASSYSINGLLITSLPPITKPAIRNSIEEIDGRDGDIVTRLGYQAYSKKVGIGLYGEFEIDKVISFFDSSGKVTFSNEPDKFYDYQILDAIDFERAIRFRTASVSFHVQPYKHSVMERPKTWKFTKQSQSVEVVNSGNIASCPTITIVGSGVVEISVNGTLALSANITQGGIMIDVGEMNAYVNGSGIFANRAVSGDYGALRLKPGSNILSWTGAVSELTVSDYSRWI